MPVPLEPHVEEALKKGISFGLTSGIITTLGLMVGLNSATGSRLAVIGGILTIAIADAFSDALGIHISEEAEGKHTEKQIWTATLSTFASKLVFALTFLIPVLLFPLSEAVLVSIAYGLSALAILSYLIARQSKEDPKKVIFEHVAIAIIVIAASSYVGTLISQFFG